MGSSPSRRSTAGTGNVRPSYASWVPLGPRNNFSFSGDVGRRTPFDVTERRTPTPPPTDTQLKVLSADLKVKGNGQAHNTYELDEVDALVVRRGKAFEVGLQLNRPYNKSTDSIQFDFQTGTTHSFQQGTRILVALDGSLVELTGEWKAEVVKEEDINLTVSITASSKALVGKYSLSVRTKVASSDDSTGPEHFTFRETGPIFLLFNAWCEGDQVYLSKPEERMEYVMNDEGFIWYGNWAQMGRRPWSFSQFEKGVFDAVMYLLETHVTEFARGNPILVSRVMSAAVNSPDDNGVLSGRWDGDYAPYNRPTKWTGSQRILEEHFKTKAPVRYGQCWVFSGVLTTVLRCLGIPTRSLTNFASAHDTDNSLTIDTYFDENGDKLYSPDSVWNFHVWNEAWMSRPDLPAGYGGWQVVDSTPQETSDGIYCTGPCPVNAIKQGHVYYPYDGMFIFAEVNGDRIYWRRADDGTEIITKKTTNSVGKNISTKAVGSKERMDLTHDYKHPEGSDAERAAVKTASGYGSKPFVYDTPNNVEDVEMSITLQDLFIGADFDITVPMSNKSAENRTVSITVTVQVVYYTGVLAGKLKTNKDKVTLGPGSEDKVNFHIDADEYLDKLVDQAAFKVFLHGHVDETGQAFVDEADFRLRTPDLDFKLIQPAASEIRVGTDVEAELSLKNPLKKTLTKCEISVEGPGLLSPRVYKCGNVASGGTLTQTVKFKPRKAGEKTLIATFESDQLSQVTGELDVNVKQQ